MNFIFCKMFKNYVYHHFNLDYTIKDHYILIFICHYFLFFLLKISNYFINYLKFINNCIFYLIIYYENLLLNFQSIHFNQKFFISVLKYIYLN